MSKQERLGKFHTGKEFDINTGKKTGSEEYKNLGLERWFRETWVQNPYKSGL